MTLYAERDFKEHAEYYGKHVSAMTAEGLHDKSDIAFELAHRDMLIDKLKAEIEELNSLQDSYLSDIGSEVYDIDFNGDDSSYQLSILIRPETVGYALYVKGDRWHGRVARLDVTTIENEP